MKYWFFSKKKIFIIILIIFIIAGIFTWQKGWTPSEKEKNIKEKNVAEFLYFNPKMNFGWFYIAQTIPEKGIAFWAAIVRSFSVLPTDESAHLLYGIMDEKKNDFQFRIVYGSFFEDANKINLSFINERDTISFEQVESAPDKFKLNANLSWGKNRFQIDKILNFNHPIIYESGDGVIPMGEGVNSLYVSLPLEQGFWVDFQKFNIPLNKVAHIQPNHRWASFMLTENAGTLPAGTVGVYWEIFDKKGNPQPGGYTNFDLLIPGKPQKTVDNFQIEEYKHNEEIITGKKYLKKWRLIQKELGIDLIFETLVPNAFCDTTNFNFYEGMTKVYDSFNPGKQVGTGMLEQTHDEAEDDLKKH